MIKLYAMRFHQKNNPEVQKLNNSKWSALFSSAIDSGNLYLVLVAMVHICKNRKVDMKLNMKPKGLKFVQTVWSFLIFFKVWLVVYSSVKKWPTVSGF